MEFVWSAGGRVLRTRRRTGLGGATLTRATRASTRLRRSSCLAVGMMAYAPVAGHISPAGAETAKSGANPALSRNCDAPRHGDEPGRPPCAERTAALGGRAV